MNKRTFLKVISGAAAAGPMSKELMAWAEAERLRNWAGNIEYSTQTVYEAKTVDETRQLVTSHAKLRPLGTRHCFNRIADSRDGFISVKTMDDPIALDEAAQTVMADAGITYGKLAPLLEAKGLALHNLASLPHISVGGAISTGTHGSGERNGNLSTAVVGLELVNAAGDVVHLERGKHDEFHGAVVGLGALGVITKVMLKVQPTYSMRQYVYENLPMDQMKQHFDEIEASGYSVSLFTDWQKRRINEVWVKCKAGDKFYDGPDELFGARRATKNLHPIAELGAENCTEQLGVPGPWYERLPHFRMGFTPSAGKELQTEYFVPRSKAVDAIMAVERLHERIGPHLLITEIRTIAADDLWLSPAYKRESVAIHFTWKQEWDAVRKLLPLIEQELAPFGPRPHWGKLFAMPGAKVQAAYERMPDFVKLSAKFDPQGEFRNDFLKANVFGG